MILTSNVISINGEQMDELNIQKRIDEMRKIKDAELKSKVKKLSETDLSITDILTPDDIEEILERNAFFKGKVTDLTKVHRHQMIVKISKWLDAKSFDVEWFKANPLSNEHASAAIILSLKQLTSFRELELQAITAMCSLADEICLSSLGDKSIRLSFIVESVFAESLDDLEDSDFELSVEDEMEIIKDMCTDKLANIKHNILC